MPLHKTRTDKNKSSKRHVHWIWDNCL